MAKRTQAVETQAVETQAVETQAVETLNDIKESLRILEQKKAEKIARVKANTLSNKYYPIISEYVEKNGLALKSVKNEDNKVFIQKNGRNIMFLLFKSHNVVSTYTAFEVNDDSQYSTYNKKLCFRTNFSSSTENESVVLDLIEKSTNYVVTSKTVNVQELLSKINNLEKTLK